MSWGTELWVSLNYQLYFWSNWSCVSRCVFSAVTFIYFIFSWRGRERCRVTVWLCVGAAKRRRCRPAALLAGGAKAKANPRWCTLTTVTTAEQ